jgi:ABC-type uncharacterized transport system permease subunit
MTSTAFHSAALFAYLIAAILYGANLALRSSKHAALGRAGLIAGIALHTIGIGAFCVQTHQSPFASNFGTLSVGAWIVAILYLPVELFAHAPALGVMAAPVISIMLFTGILKSHGSLANAPEIRTKIVSIHVLLVLTSFALFALAACSAVFYLWQYSILKHPDRRALFRKLPPLETADSAAYHLVAFALPLLTMGLALGFARAAGDSTRPNWMTDPHTIVSIFSWVVYCGYLVARLVAGWRGTRLNYLLLAGLIVSLALFFIPSSTHKFN